jgi:hypothetical protein
LAALCGAAAPASAQTAPAPAASGQFVAGEPLELMPNTKVYGSFRFSESLSYDEARDLYVSVNAGMPQEMAPNDGYVSLVNPDGTVHTLKWIGGGAGQPMPRAISSWSWAHRRAGDVQLLYRIVVRSAGSSRYTGVGLPSSSSTTR